MNLPLTLRGFHLIRMVMKAKNCVPGTPERWRMKSVSATLGSAETPAIPPRVLTINPCEIFQRVLSDKQRENGP